MWQLEAPLADHGQSLSRQGGTIQGEVPRRMSPSLFRQVAQPRPVQYLLYLPIIMNNAEDRKLFFFLLLLK